MPTGQFAPMRAKNPLKRSILNCPAGAVVAMRPPDWLPLGPGRRGFRPRKNVSPIRTPNGPSEDRRGRFPKLRFQGAGSEYCFGGIVRMTCLFVAPRSTSFCRTVSGEMVGGLTLAFRTTRTAFFCHCEANTTGPHADVSAHRIGQIDVFAEHSADHDEMVVAVGIDGHDQRHFRLASVRRR